MEKIKLESQEDGIVRVFELFYNILEESGSNLNQFVKGDSLAIPNGMSEIFLNSLKDFINMVPDMVKQIEDGESFWKKFEELSDYENNNKFITWLKRYTEAAIRPFEEAKFLKEIDSESFQKQTNYCFENLILKDIGKKRIDKAVGDIKQLLILKKIIFTFIEMVIVNNFSRENAFDNMERMFDVKEEYCEIWWDLIEKNEEKIWKIMMMKQYRKMENKLNYLLDIIE